MRSTENNITNAATVKAVLPYLFPARLYGNVTIVDDYNESCSCYNDRQSQYAAKEVFDQFIQFHFPKQNLSVVAVRGTNPSEILDVLVDIRLWSESLMLNVRMMLYLETRAHCWGLKYFATHRQIL